MSVTAAASGGDHELTVGEVVDYLQQVKVPVSIDGFVMQYKMTAQIGEDGLWAITDRNY